MQILSESPLADESNHRNASSLMLFTVRSVVKII